MDLHFFLLKNNKIPKKENEITPLRSRYKEKFSISFAYTLTENSITEVIIKTI
jgi:hypothetical protein